MSREWLPDHSTTVYVLDRASVEGRCTCGWRQTVPGHGESAILEGFEMAIAHRSYIRHSEHFPWVVKP